MSGRGRPCFPEGEAKSEMLRLRCRRSELDRWCVAADTEGVSLSQWVRSKLNAVSGEFEIEVPSSLLD